MRHSPANPVRSADRPDRNPEEIERARAADLAMLALDRRGGVPQHLGAVLLLDAQPASVVATPPPHPVSPS